MSSLPVQASYHYCLGRVKQISFYEVNDPNCVCPADEDLRDCCATEHTVLDFQDDHTPFAKAALEPVFSVVAAPLGVYEMPQAISQTRVSTSLRGPPPSAKCVGIYLMNCNFRL
ncbi:MAG: hypothetical protein C0424_01775 [Sphingobacteriaceae bacterium]|nr:hypothetical protein [Sphingobacteriaceae bacterium]